MFSTASPEEPIISDQQPANGHSTLTEVSAVSDVSPIPKSALPASWQWTTIGDVADTTSGGTPSRKHPEFYGGATPWVKSGELGDSLVTNVEETITDEGLRGSNAKLFPTGTPLVALYGATVGRTGILGFDAATNQAVCAMFPRHRAFTAKYIVYWLQSQRQALVDMSVGGAQPNINQGVIRSFPFPLAPLGEQHRIVAAIEQQLTRLDAGVAALKAAQARLRRYKATVLKAACEGRLVPQEPADEPADALLRRLLAERRAKWEAEQEAKMRAQGRMLLDDGWRAKYVEPQGPDTTELPELPQGWVWIQVKQAGYVQLGRQRAPQHHSGEHMRPYLRVANVYEDRIDTSDIMEMNFSPSEYETYELHYGDILLNEGQSKELVGRPAMYRNEVPGACFQNTLVRFRAYDIVLPDFALIVFRAYLHAERFQKIARWTTNIAHLGAERFAEMEFPLPPLAEQQGIVAEVERRLSVVAEVEAAVAANLKRAERLRQAILKRAFEGKLVPQDPSDEPASALLERIRADRGAEAGRPGDKETRRRGAKQLRMEGM